MTAGTSAADERFRAALPDVTSNITLAGLDGPVEIARDRLGIPHVRATTLHDAFFGQGFVHAQDRLWQMDFDRRRAAGTAAAWAGRALLDHDILMRRLGIVASARADYEAFDPATRAMMDAYAEGVNAFIQSTATLPVEYALLGVAPEPWQPWDSGSIFKVRHVLMGSWGSKLWRARLLQTLGPEAVVKLGTRGAEDGVLIVPPAAEYSATLADVDILSAGIEALSETPDFGGSNNWVVAGSRTASGKPLVAGDPHRFIDVPNVYYQNRLACPEFDALGFSFAGVPGFPHFGHNAHVAWAITHASADYQDLYVERFDPADPTRYEFRGEWLAAETRSETIAVRGADDVEIDVTVTRHGPVVVGDPRRGAAIAMHYTALDVPNPGLRCLLPQLLATSYDELEEAMRDWVDPCNNMVMADQQGEIGYLHRGRVPIRNRANGWLPVPGWTGEHEWQGDIPFEELPRSRNPETGWAATANQRVVGDDYPHYLSLDYAPPWRGIRLRDRLNALADATIDDMAAIHADRVSIPSRVLTAKIAGVQVDDPLAEEARRRLMAWDGVAEKESVATLLHAAVRDYLTRAVIASEKLRPLGVNPYREEPAPLGPGSRLFGAILALLDHDDTSLLDDGVSWQQLLGRALTEATAHLRETLGDDMDTWRWDRVHTTRAAHPLASVFPELAGTLNPPSVPLAGESDTVQASGWLPGQHFGVNLTSVARYAFDLADWDRSRWVVPLGGSGHPGSPHYADQAHDWSDVRMNAATWAWDTVTADAKTTQRLLPG